MDRVALHVPTVLNDGSPVPGKRLTDYESELLGIAEMATLLSGRGQVGLSIAHVTGIWRSPTGQILREPVARFEMDVADQNQVLADVLQLAERVKDELGQLAVYVTTSLVEVLVVRSEDETWAAHSAR